MSETRSDSISYSSSTISTSKRVLIQGESVTLMKKSLSTYIMPPDREYAGEIASYTVNHIGTSLGECACLHFDRQRTNRRSFIENQSYQIATEIFSDARHLNVLFLCAGRFLQESIISKMLLKSWNSLHADAMEVDQKDSFESAAEEFKKLPVPAGKSFSADIYPTMLEYQASSSKTKNNIHIAYAIDIDLCTLHPSNLLFAYQNILPNGFLYVAIRDVDILIRKDGSFTDWYYPKPEGRLILWSGIYEMIVCIPEVANKIARKELPPGKKGYMIYEKSEPMKRSDAFEDALSTYLPGHLTTITKHYLGTLFSSNGLSSTPKKTAETPFSQIKKFFKLS